MRLEEEKSVAFYYRLISSLARGLPEAETCVRFTRANEEEKNMLIKKTKTRQRMAVSRSRLLLNSSLIKA